MIKVAIVGNIASGKSTVEQMILNKGYLVFDTDVLAHEILQDKAKIVKNIFKDFDILDENSSISRYKLGKIIFCNKEYKERLENIIYPDLKQRINDIFETNKDKKFIFISVPLLFEVGWESMFDKILFIQANDELRLLRLINRNNYTKSEAMSRIVSQKAQDGKMKKSDFIICNNDDIMLLQKQVDEFIILLEDVE